MPDAYFADLENYVRDVRVFFEDKLKALVDIPTISVDPKYETDIVRGAEAAAGLLRELGFKVQVVETAGNPVIFGELVNGINYPTVLIYNHLDVQPADTPDWRTDPFNLVVDGDRYIGRGATDDKGPALTALMAILYAQKHRLPLNYKIAWELEEEIGSPHFEDFVKGSQKQLAADSVVVSDTIWISAGKPAIPVGLRGMAAFELSLQTSEADTHSGLTGGAARNPVGEIAQILSECYDAMTGRVNIPGFYEDVVPATTKEVDSFVASGFSVEQFIKDHGLRTTRSSDTRDMLERIMACPTFEVHGIKGGYTGPGVKAIVPPRATAKVSMRLVPSQDPRKVFELVKRFIAAKHPDVEVKLVAAMPPYFAALDGPFPRAASAAMEFGFGTKPAFVREGGSIGAVITMAEYLKVPVLMLGLSLPEHGYHAPNEHFDWGQASGGIKMYVKYFREISGIRGA